MSEGWCLIVINAPADDAELHRMGLRPLRGRPTTLLGRYHANAEAQLRRHIAMIKARHLHGRAMRNGRVAAFLRSIPSTRPRHPRAAASPARTAAAATPLLGHTAPQRRPSKRSSSPALAVPLGADHPSASR